MTDKKSSKIRLALYSILTIFIILTIVVSYSLILRDNTLKRIEDNIVQNTNDTTEDIDLQVYYAYNSIQIASSQISSNMTGKDLENPNSAIAEVIEKTPFSGIEYINYDGINMTNAGASFDASNRVYYIEGIAGKTGIWINFYPKYANEPLLNFYTPLYYADEIVGVITGTLGGNTDLRRQMISQVNKQPVSGLILDENNKIISSNYDFKTGVDIDYDTIRNIDERDKRKFLDAIKDASGDVTYLMNNGSKSICVVSKIESTNWKLVQIIPSGSIKKILMNSTIAANISVIAIIAVGLTCAWLMIRELRKMSKMDVDVANHERDYQHSINDSIAGIYYTMHVLDIKKDAAQETKTTKEISSIVTKYKTNQERLNEVVRFTIRDSHLDNALGFVDLSTLKERINGKHSIAVDLNGKHVGWIRMSFIKFNNDDDKIIITTQIIDDQKSREEALKHQSNTDELTGFQNRRSYERNIDSLRKGKKDNNLVYISLDINGLKSANDNIGHNAGDELIKGAAMCMAHAFQPYGTTFRVGGDEFVAIINANSDELEKIFQDFERETSEWHGEYANNLYVSYGYVCGEDMANNSIDDVIIIADKKMYENKACFYRNKGFDRRGQKAAHIALCNLYTKILKVNITNDTYEIINVSEDEIKDGIPKTISGWLEMFGKSDNVHPQDRETFLEQSRLDNLSRAFEEGRVSVTILYRRKSKDKYKQAVMELIPTENYSSNNQELFLYVKTLEK